MRKIFASRCSQTNSERCFGSAQHDKAAVDDTRVNDWGGFGPGHLESQNKSTLTSVNARHYDTGFLTVPRIDAGASESDDQRREIRKPALEQDAEGIRVLWDQDSVLRARAWRSAFSRAICRQKSFRCYRSTRNSRRFNSPTCDVVGLRVGTIASGELLQCWKQSRAGGLPTPIPPLE